MFKYTIQDHDGSGPGIACMRIGDAAGWVKAAYYAAKLGRELAERYYPVP